MRISDWSSDVCSSDLGTAMDQDLPATAPPLDPIPPVTPSDRAAAFPDVDGHAVHDTAIHSYWLLDRLETWDGDEDGTGVGWEALAWIGTDLDRVWLRSEGESVDGIGKVSCGKEGVSSGKVGWVP